MIHHKACRLIIVCILFIAAPVAAKDDDACDGLQADEEEFSLLQSQATEEKKVSGSSVPLLLRSHVSKSVGWPAALVCIFFFGTQSVHARLETVRRAESTWLMKACFSFGVACLGFLIGLYLLAVGVSPFCKWGAYASLIYCPGTMLMLTATKRIGVGLATGFIVTSACITSNLTAILFLGAVMSNPWAAALCMLGMVCGVKGLTIAMTTGQRRREEEACMNKFGDSGYATFNYSGFWGKEKIGDGTNVDALGVILAIVSGMIYGCLGLPLHNAVNPIASGCSMMCTQFFVMSLIVAVRMQFAPESLLLEDFPSSHKEVVYRAAMHAMLGGACFGVGFLGQVLCLRAFGVATGFPLTQSQLVVACFWSIALFGDVTGTDLICATVLSAAVVLASLTLLVILR